MELEVTWKRALKVWWAFLWRNVLAVLMTVILSAIAGFMVSVILGLLGVGDNVLLIIAQSLGIVIGLLVSIIPVKLILGRDYGEFRLVLIRNEKDAERG